MTLFKHNKGIIILLVCTLFVLCYIMPVEAKTNEETYQEKLTQLKPDDVDGRYQLGLWCLKNKLADEAKTEFNKVLELNPDHKKARQSLDSVIQLEKDAKMAEIIKKYGPYKGVLGKPGADKEKLPWEKAREKETDHLIVKTNLSVDALNDLCCLLECAYFTYQDIFGFDAPKEKLRVMVAKNENEYQKIRYDLDGTNPPATSRGIFISAFGPNNKSRQNHLLSFYNQLKGDNTFLHECTHYATELARQKYKCFNLPIWIHEGWATYYEESRLEGKGLVTNVINQEKLPVIKDAINKQTYIKLKDFINLNRAWNDCDPNICYSEGWSLMYFLLNGQGGKYKTGLQAYMEAWGKGKIVMVKNDYPQDKLGHLKIFEECMGVPIDQLEKEWKEYILSLK